MAIHNQGRLGCGNCRSRRIKCNQLRPRCSQCARAGLSCFGYRDPVDLLFQDQTAYIKQKYQVAGSTESVCKSQALPCPSSSASLISVEEMAWWYYFENFNIMRPPGAPVHQAYPSYASSVTPSVASVGLAALALVHGDPHLMQLARKQYSSALKSLIGAIKNPKEINQATTVTASFNLSMFEMIVCDDSQPLSYSWLHHMHGTTSLLGSFELAEDASTIEVKAILQIAYTAALACLISKIKVPTFLVALLQRCGKLESATLLCPLIDLFTLLCTLVNLHFQTSQLQVMNRQRLIAIAIRSFRNLETWTTTIPSWWIDPIRTGKPPRLDDESWIMRVWVYYRLGRLLAHRVIMDNLDILHTASISSQNRQYEESKEVISQALEELYIGVPALLGASNIANRATPRLTCHVFFLVTVLQAIGSLTATDEVAENWSSQANKVYGEDFNVIQKLILTRLN